ncbi:hypothetical protein EG68_03526 [Paragonimus skrjabini miyazakii]|uniref:Uncharacterized protein n=1 Tax=Paragonimus skrjabini miyazakii TaxID=59628 RepID=A0A8S9Z6X2_9TREM|nr:hypothetical protein EG68_03526 [Paragonimus skrjabini miyazakii]
MSERHADRDYEEALGQCSLERGVAGQMKKESALLATDGQRNNELLWEECTSDSFWTEAMLFGMMSSRYVDIVHEDSESTDSQTNKEDNCIRTTAACYVINFWI